MLDARIRYGKESSFIILDLHGKFNFEATKNIRDILINELPRIKTLLVNLEGVNFIDSSGLGLLISAKNSLKKLDSSMYICCLTPQVRRVFQQVNFLEYFKIYETEAEALQDLEK